MAEIPVDPRKPEIQIDRWHEENTDRTPRPYMGISMLGHECPRYIWLVFRWAVIPEFNGRMLRLFERGQREEAVIVEDLKRIGCDVRHTGDDQYEVNLGGWIKGHLDGIIESGLPEAPKSRHVLEMKTHNDKSFQKLKESGVKKAKPQHYVQMQCYMLATGIDRALYFAVNKNDDSIYTERVKLDKEFAQEQIDRAQDIACDIFMPRRCSNDPESFTCKYCECHKVCWGEELCSNISCRTCRFFEAERDGTAHCLKYVCEIPTDCQYMGCEEFSFYPEIGKDKLCFS